MLYVWIANENLKMKGNIDFINTTGNKDRYNLTNMLVNAPFLYKITVKHTAFSILLLITLLFVSSCKTCKCPAYSELNTKGLPENNITATGTLDSWFVWDKWTPYFSRIIQATYNLYLVTIKYHIFFFRSPGNTNNGCEDFAFIYIFCRVWKVQHPCQLYSFMSYEN